MKKGLTAILLAVLCTFLIYGIRYMSSPLTTQKAVYGTYEEAVYTDCYFVRDEIVYAAGTSGTVYNHFSDGMRAGKNVLISTVYSGNVSEDVLRQLNTIDKKIENIRKSSVTVNVGNDEANVENRIESYKHGIIASAVDNDIRSVRAYTDAISSVREGVQGLTATDNVNMLLRQKEAEEARIGGNKQEIYSESAGVFSTVLDGMEHILTPDKVREYTVADYNNIAAGDTKTANQTQVDRGDSICKIVNNHKWYVLCAISSNRVSDKEIGTSVTMRFDNIPGAEVLGRIVNVSKSQGGKSVVMIESSQYVEGAYSMRTSPMELIFKSYSGYVVPINAIRNKEGVKGVLGRRNNVEDFYPCQVIYTDENAEYVIIKTPEEAEKKLENVHEFVLGER